MKNISNLRTETAMKLSYYYVFTQYHYKVLGLPSGIFSQVYNLQFIFLPFSLFYLHSSSMLTFSFFMTELSNDNCGPGLVERLSLNSKRFTILLFSFLMTLTTYFSCCFRTKVCSDSVLAIRHFDWLSSMISAFSWTHLLSFFWVETCKQRWVFAFVFVVYTRFDIHTRLCYGQENS